MHTTTKLRRRDRFHIGEATVQIGRVRSGTVEVTICGCEPEIERAIPPSAERAAILAALKRNHWRRAATARDLGISGAILRAKMVAFGLLDFLE